VLGVGDVAQVESDLAVLDRAEAATPLSLHPDGGVPLRGGSKTSTASGRPKSRATWRFNSSISGM
jgi:hypothetical protein